MNCTPESGGQLTEPGDLGLSDIIPFTGKSIATFAGTVGIIGIIIGYNDSDFASCWQVVKPSQAVYRLLTV